MNIITDNQFKQGQDLIPRRGRRAAPRPDDCEGHMPRLRGGGLDDGSHGDDCEGHMPRLGGGRRHAVVSGTARASRPAPRRRRISRALAVAAAPAILGLGTLSVADTAAAQAVAPTGARATTVGTCGFRQFTMRTTQNTGFEYVAYRFYYPATSYTAASYSTWSGWTVPASYPITRSGRGNFAIQLKYADRLVNGQWAYAHEWMLFADYGSYYCPAG